MNCSSIRCLECGQCNENNEVKTVFERAVECFGPLDRFGKASEEAGEFISQSQKAARMEMNRENFLDEYVDLFHIMKRQIDIIMKQMGFTQEEIDTHIALKVLKLEEALAKKGYGYI